MANLNPMAAAIMGSMGGPAGAPPTAPPMPALGGPPRAPIGSATGAPPATGIGALPTGDVDTHTAASSAILWLKALKDHFPGMRDTLDGWIAQIQSQANPRLSPPAPPNASAGAPGLPVPPAIAPPPDSGPPMPPSV